ncbi:MAG: hAT transposon family protein, partial [Bacteroidetes bacterium]
MILKIKLTCSLCQIIAVLPATSVDCERGFSNLNRIKTDNRNKLQALH